ncbi:MAG: DUF3015 domain-containing protein [Proteobacteria bacterium]|nr:MAG: DUF3015 domain-containing protein [Pseudomonadota bacterium]
MKKFLVIALAFTVTASSFAGDQSSGCGLGWELFKKNSLVSSFSRTITNAIASNTIAMTSGTSGCARHDIVMKHQEALHYAEANYQKLLSEVAIGSGEHLSSFVAILGCEGANGVSASALLQSQYGELFPIDSASPSHLLNESTRTIYSSPLQSSCQLLKSTT